MRKLYVVTRGRAFSSDSRDLDYPQVWYRPVAAIGRGRWERGMWMPLRSLPYPRLRGVDGGRDGVRAPWFLLV